MKYSMANETITLPATLVGFSPKVDKSVSLRFESQELESKSKIDLMSLLGAFGGLAFRPNSISLKDIPTEDVEDKDKKPSKRLRNVLFVLSQQRGIKKENFDAWYRTQVEKIIEQIKLKLDS